MESTCGPKTALKRATRIYSKAVILLYFVLLKLYVLYDDYKYHIFNISYIILQI